MNFYDSMNDWNFTAVGVEDDDLSWCDERVGVVQKQDVSTIEPWFHAATENYDHRRVAARH